MLPTSRDARVQRRAASSCPVTAITHIPDSHFALAGSARRLLFLSLASGGDTGDDGDSPGWDVFERERIHRIVLQPEPAEPESAGWRVLVLGGKEAVLAHLVLGGSRANTATLDIVQRFSLNDFVGDGAFLDDDLVILSTLHNSLHLYPLLPHRASSAHPATSVPPTPPAYTLHAPLRPLLWCTRFSRAQYRSRDAADQAEGRITLAGGSLWGDTFLWKIGQAVELANSARDARSRGESEGTVVAVAKEDSLRRLVGHQGAVFTTAFSPCTRYLVTGSDDRTLRVWDLSLIPAAPSSAGTTIPHLTMWGHIARVWRAVFLPTPSPTAASSSSSHPPATAAAETLDLASVAEDGTCRLWRVSRAAVSAPSPAAAHTARQSAAEKGYALLETWREGHDGRSIWSVEGARLPRLSENGEAGEEEEGRGRRVVLTGGADGAVRCWVVPQPIVDGVETSAQGKGKKGEKGEKVKAFAVELVGRADLVVLLKENGSFFAFAHTPDHASTAAIAPPADFAPFHAASTWSSSSTACTLRLLPRSSSATPAEFTFVAFSNRGAFLRASITISSDGVVAVSHVTELSLDVKPVTVSFGGESAGGLRRIAVWDHAALRVGVLELDLESAPLLPPRLLASLQLPPSPARAPTTLHFLSRSLILLGNAGGSVALYRMPTVDQLESTAAPSELVEVALLKKLHGDGVMDFSSTQLSSSGKEMAWRVETVGRDGRRCVLRVEVGDEGGEVEVLDRRTLTKGVLDQIVLGGHRPRYLSHSDTRAILIDELAQQHHSFASPGKKLQHRLVAGSDGTAPRFYRLERGKLLLHTLDTSADSPAPVLHAGLHGREIRAVEATTLNSGLTLVATAAENGVLSLSRLSSSNRLKPLYSDRHIPSSLKSLSWSPPTVPQRPRLLFACGTRELLCAFSVAEEGEAGVLVRPKGTVLGEEGGEVRAMDFAVLRLPQHDGEKAKHVLAVGYSDGTLRLWRHCSDLSYFMLLSSTQPGGKCILTVEGVELDFEDGGKRWIVVTGSSDGLLAVYDLTSFASPSPTLEDPISPPVLAYHPHQSGINALALQTSGRDLIVATGGDDNAVGVSRLAFSASSHDSPLNAALIAQTSLSDAHASTIQGLDFLSPSLLASSSVEQRLNIYTLSSAASPSAPTLALKLHDSTCLDVADCSAQAAVAGAEGVHRLVVAGIGAEVIDVSVQQ